MLTIRLPLTLLCVLATGCASMVRGTTRSLDLAPNGLSRADDGFRRSLSAGAYQQAFLRAASPKRGAPDDALLRGLYRGLTAFHAGNWSASATAFADADRLVERRLTRSISREAATLVANDLVLAYLPTRTERLFLRYYAMHAHARGGNTEGAVVEARRLGRDLEHASSELSEAEKPVHAAMRDAAGAIFESAGEHNDALVSYRNAALLRGTSRALVDSIALSPPPADSATLIVFVESGWVAHRVDQGLTIGLDDGWAPRRRPDGDRERGSTDSTATDRFAPEELAQYALQFLDATPDGGVFGIDGRGDWSRVNRPMRVGPVSSSFVRVAWPALVRTPFAPGGLSLLLHRGAVGQGAPEESAGDQGPAVRSLAHGADISAALGADIRRARAAMLVRAATRALSRGALTRKLREKHGEWASVAASLAGSVVERADTRSWQLLPGFVSMVRVTVPAGLHDVAVRIGADEPGVAARLPQQELKGGQTVVTTVRVWRDASQFAPVVATTRDTFEVLTRKGSEVGPASASPAQRPAIPPR
ncbi:MAG: hypothetical protein V4617_13065 [Gemmatimonadota bacterium]